MSIYNNIINVFSNIKSMVSTTIRSSIEVVTDKNARKERITQGVILIFVVFVACILYFATTDKEALLSKTYLYIFLSVIPIFLIFTYTLSNNENIGNSIFKTFLLGFIILFFFGIFYFYSTTTFQLSKLGSVIINFILFLIIAIGMGIFFIVFSNYLKSYTGIQGFIIYFIFYIPCLVVDSFRYLLKEYKSTTNDVVVLFSLELVFVLLYIYLPQLMSTISNSNGITLLEDSVFLDIRHTIDTKLIAIQPSDDLLQYGAINYRKNYAISLWTYLNNEPLNNKSYSKESLIFSYGNGKPMITYYNEIDVNNDTNNSFLKTDKYIVYFTNAMKNGPVSVNKKINLPSQKWNNLVFNYYSDHVDLFVNGNLELTYQFDDTNRPKYEPTDMINIGSKDGLNGAVCNVRYYTEPLSKSNIINMYNLLMYKNPPVFYNKNSSVFDYLPTKLLVNSIIS